MLNFLLVSEGVCGYQKQWTDFEISSFGGGGIGESAGRWHGGTVGRDDRANGRTGAVVLEGAVEPAAPDGARGKILVPRPHQHRACLFVSTISLSTCLLYLYNGSL